MTSESGAVAQTFADLPQNAVCSEVSWGISRAVGMELIRSIPDSNAIRFGPVLNVLVYRPAAGAGICAQPAPAAGR
jgi:hypothetical protein